MGEGVDLSRPPSPIGGLLSQPLALARKDQRNVLSSRIIPRYVNGVPLLRSILGMPSGKVHSFAAVRLFASALIHSWNFILI
jgi:hypothetical protein